VSVVGNEQWDCFTLFKFCFKLDWDMIPKFQNVGISLTDKPKGY
jgi:hypothetical protein